MSEYQFRTTATMKPYNSRQWWITPDIIRTKYITADSLTEALTIYFDDVKEQDYITISANAMRIKSPMFRDMPNGEPQQVGYVITASTDMQRDNGTWSTQYIDLWVDISIIIPADFEQEAV